MTADFQSPTAVPVAVAGDPDDVVWALETSAVEWGRGSYSDSIAWIRRAAEAAIEREAWGRARELNAVAAQLARMIGQGSSAPPAATTVSKAPPASAASAVDELLAMPTATPRTPIPPAFRAPEVSTSVEFVEVDADEIEAELVESGGTYEVDDGLEAIESHEEIEVSTEIEPELELELDAEIENDGAPEAPVQTEETWDDLTVRADDALSSSPEATYLDVEEIGDADVASLIENPPPREEPPAPRPSNTPVRAARVLRAKDDYLDSDAELDVPARTSAPPSSHRSALSARGGRPPPPPPEVAQVVVPPPSMPAPSIESPARAAEPPAPEPSMSEPFASELSPPPSSLGSADDTSELTTVEEPPSSRKQGGSTEALDRPVASLADKGISERLAQALRTHELSQRRRSSKPPEPAPASRRRPDSLKPPPSPSVPPASTGKASSGSGERERAPRTSTRPSASERSSARAASEPAPRTSTHPTASERPSARPSASERVGAPQSSRRGGSGPASSAPASEPIIQGVSLQSVEGLEDLPVEAQHKLAQSVRITELSGGEVVGDFSVALVLRGEVEVRPADAAVTAAEVRRAEVVFTRGSLDEPFALRVVAGANGATVALWDVRALDEATRDCPWVADELRVVADRHRALAGLCVGDLGTRLDLGLRKMVFEKFEVRYVLPGEMLCQQGERLTGMYVIGAGGIEIVVGTGADARVSRVLGSGDVLFARQVLGAGSAPASARGAPSGALVLFAARPVAHELMLSVPPLLEILAG